MWRVLLVAGAVLATAIALYMHSEMTRQGAPTVLLGIPVTNVSSSDFAWIAVDGRGFVVLRMGVGFVTFGFVGVGLLFAVGQACAGGIAIGQGALGLTFVLGQLAFGWSGFGQLAIGGHMRGQGVVGKDKGMLRALDAWLGRTLSFRRT